MMPEFWSLEFHTRFFPALLRSRLTPRERAGSGFTSSLEKYFLIILSLIFIVFGIPGAILRHSVIGWIAVAIGFAGIIALIINSIFSRESSPDYEQFLWGVFFFFVIMGLSAGIFAGSLNHSLLLGIVIGAAGIIAGYFIGIAAGLWFQYLGWLASLVNGMAVFAVIGMFCVDLVIVAGSLF
jgi:hypothetical protein